MRELVFALEYEPGCNRVADTLADHPEARIRSLSLHATPERLWRVDHATGDPDALAAIEDAFITADYYADCLATGDCGAVQTTQVLEHAADTLVLYSYWERTLDCASVPHIALEHLGTGVLFETRHEGRHYTWRLIHSGEGDVGAFFDELEAAVGDCAQMEMLRTAEAKPTGSEPADGAGGLPPEQDAALRAAVEHGYYESPRAVDVGDLAEHLEVPRSTLTYRLRRAEEQLAKRYVADGPGASDPSQLL
ncbi:helix-turn-helix domain-containing protein [Halopiger xanaduensis]|uniref:Bacterio-opsin activator HTH domain protein n=1 Tax=Halopiger xanaduensis (strain DSM 18323 / JCM 14033 / SH-6) TaxID=797210 RepID=F8DDD6_HALXS|nr:helix-turn-helix domain-containing protein [Halopiger xanaduensis]AEH39026.1 Bacterio-opsin activator HTH domain protein [Halopiger xanaduensis SH-6]